MQAVPHRISVSLGLNDCQGNVTFRVENVICPFWTTGSFGIGNTFGYLATDHDATGREWYFLHELILRPACFQDGWGNQFRADITFRQGFFVESAHSYLPKVVRAGRKLRYQVGGYPGLRAQWKLCSGQPHQHPEVHKFTPSIPIELPRGSQRTDRDAVTRTRLSRQDTAVVGEWHGAELQPTSKGYELIPVDDCDAGEVPGGALVDAT